MNNMKYLGGEIAYESHVFSKISEAANSSVFVMGCNGKIQLPFTLSDLLDRKKVRSIIKTQGGKSIEIYEIFRERTNIIIISENQIGANADIFSDRSPKLGNHPSWEFGYTCGLYGFGLIGYAFLDCIGFCGEKNCARTIQRKALQILYTFIKNAKKRFLQRRRKQMLIYQKALQHADVKMTSSISIIFIATNNSFIYGNKDPKFLKHICGFC